MKNAGKACNNRLYRHIRTFEKIVKNYFVILSKYENLIYERLEGWWYKKAIEALCSEDPIFVTQKIKFVRLLFP